MKTYWDYTEKERAAFTREEVEGFLDRELMERGVLKVIAPKLELVESEPAMRRETWYSVGGLLFKTVDDANAVVNLHPHKEGYNWSADYKYKYAETVETEIQQVQLYVRADVDAFAKILAKNKRAKEANEKANSEYMKASTAQDKVLDGVWSDWSGCRDKADKNQKVLDTASEYIRMTESNRDLAREFLGKAFSESEITSAEEWFGAEIWPFQIVGEAVAS